MATQTSTSTNTSISQKGDVFTVKEVTTKTIKSPGKEPKVEVTETVNEYKGEANLPEHIRQRLVKKSIDEPLNMNATRGNFAEDALSEVNKYRKFHRSDPLSLSAKMNAHCEERAKKMADADDMIDTGDGGYGESVSCMSSNDPEFHVKADAVVSRWYSGSQGYDYAKEPTEMSAGHFTQMVWKETKEFGIAAVKSKTNQIYVVAAFHPRGNYSKQFVQNVNPPMSGGVTYEGIHRAKKLLFGNGIQSLFGVSDRKGPQKCPRRGDAPEVSQLNLDCVECHNEYRKRHGVPPLKYSKELAAYAQEWANEIARTERFEHSSEGNYGENLYYAFNSDPGKVPEAAEACDSWYSEIADYTFGREPRSTGTGHFTQMVWRDTKEVGMGLARSKSGKYFIVANYSPPGNYIGRYTENVPKPQH